MNHGCAGSLGRLFEQFSRPQGRSYRTGPRPRATKREVNVYTEKVDNQDNDVKVPIMILKNEMSDLRKELSDITSMTTSRGIVTGRKTSGAHC